MQGVNKSICKREKFLTNVVLAVVNFKHLSFPPTLSVGGGARGSEDKALPFYEDS